MAKRKKMSKEIRDKIISIILLIISGLGFLKYGLLGSLVKRFGIYLFGGLNLVFFGALLLLGIYFFFRHKTKERFIWRFMAIGLLLLGAIMLSHIKYFENKETYKIAYENTKKDIDTIINYLNKNEVYNPTGSGYVGFYVTYVSDSLIDVDGTKAVSYLFIFIAGFTFFGNYIIKLSKELIEKYKIYRLEKKEEKRLRKIKKEEEKAKEKDKVENKGVKINDNNNVKVYSNIEEFENKTEKKDNEGIEALLKEEYIKDPLEEKEKVNPFYTLPSIELLKYAPSKKNDSKAIIEKNIEILEKTLNEFGISGRVVEVNQGPAVTQYEMELHTGTKLNRLLSITKEISLALAKKDVRIEAPIPGKNTVGVEVPNENVSMVSLREILENTPEAKADNKLLVALGKNIMGKSFFAEINKTPHLLVAGSTGSGKSVCINCILASILMRAKPSEVKLVLIDPKKVELTMYENIPHLMHPLITDSSKANSALKAMVVEMEERFLKLEHKKVKNIEAYNELIEKENKKKNLGEQEPKMPYVVVVIDELSDLMMVAGKEVEQSILRITQKARAAGIHLIVATQRPSTDVITGIIKANIPSRLSFTVASGIDSRTILDMTGAEKLLGRGDMLYLPIGQTTPDRIQGAYVSDAELEAITDYVRSQQKASYDSSFSSKVNIPEEKANVENIETSIDRDDELYSECLKFVVKEKRASTSLLQRRFKIGYNRAANIIDLLEERGVIGGVNGSKPREVLIEFSNEDY